MIARFIFCLLFCNNVFTFDSYIIIAARHKGKYCLGSRAGKGGTMLRYRVILSWVDEFIFDDPDTAMNFAVTAMKSSVETLRVTIELIAPENKSEEVEQND